MKGDVIIVEEHHKKAASVIVPHIIEQIKAKPTRYTLTVGGESGSGKSEMGRAIADELDKHGIKSVVLGQDDYYVLPPKTNDARHREDPQWLGPHVEVKLDVLDQNFVDAINGADKITKPLIDYGANSIAEETVSLAGAKVVIAEGTYTTLLKHVDSKVFIARTRQDTLEHRQKRNRFGEAQDPFVEQLLETEHKIIAGHRFLADFLITKDYDVVMIK